MIAITKRGRIKWPVDLKHQLSEAQNHRCPFCGKYMTANGKREDLPTFEHIRPLSRGGADAIENIVISCRGCNEERNREVNRL